MVRCQGQQLDEAFGLPQPPISLLDGLGSHRDPEAAEQLEAHGLPTSKVFRITLYPGSWTRISRHPCGLFPEWCVPLPSTSSTPSLEQGGSYPFSLRNHHIIPLCIEVEACSACSRHDLCARCGISWEWPSDQTLLGSV